MHGVYHIFCYVNCVIQLRIQMSFASFSYYQMYRCAIIQLDESQVA